MIRLFKLTLITALLNLLLVGSLSAQNQVGQLGNGDVNKKVAAGTVVAAAMESIGYQAQSQVLKQMNDALSELGGLIYLGVVLSVILTAGLMGSYAPVLWLLVGPPVFIYMSGVSIAGQDNRITANGADWKFGAFKDNGGFKKKVMLKSDNPAQVSYFFHKYNEMISEVYQDIIKKITETDATMPMMFMARERVMEDLFGMELRDRNALELAGTFLSQCSGEMTLARYIAAGAENPSIQTQAPFESMKKEYCERYPAFNKSIYSTGLEDYLATLNPAHVKGTPVSCARMWVWLKQMAVKDIASQSEISLMNAFGPEALTSGIGIQGLISKVFNDILKKITSKRQDRKWVEDPCPEGSGGENREGIVGQGDSFTVLTNILSGLMIRKEQMKNSTTGFQKVLAGDKSGLVKLESQASGGGVKANVRGSEDQLRRQKAQEMAVGKKYETFTYLMLLPYFQGALLYGLAFMYPFFALLLLVPGKASSFLNWLALWAWVKSWDIGWAVVMVTDKLLWEVMPHTTYYDLGSANGYTPINLMEMHYSGDFAYSLSLYWTIVAALVTSVPIISAEIILGAKKGISSVVLAGAGDMSERLSAASANFVAAQAIGRTLDQRQAREGMGMAGQVGEGARAMQDMNNNINNHLGTKGIIDTMSGSPGAVATQQNPEQFKDASVESKNSAGEMYPNDKPK